MRIGWGSRFKRWSLQRFTEGWGVLFKMEFNLGVNLPSVCASRLSVVNHTTESALFHQYANPDCLPSTTARHPTLADKEHFVA